MIPKLKSIIVVRPCIMVGSKKLVTVAPATRAIAERILIRYFTRRCMNWYNRDHKTLKARCMKRLKRRIKPFVSKILTGSYK